MIRPTISHVLSIFSIPLLPCSSRPIQQNPKVEWDLLSTLLLPMSSLSLQILFASRRLGPTKHGIHSLSLQLGPRWPFLFSLLKPWSLATPRSSITIKNPLEFSVPTLFLFLCSQFYPLPRKPGQNLRRHPQSYCPGLPSLTSSVQGIPVLPPK